MVFLINIAWLLNLLNALKIKSWLLNLLNTLKIKAWS